MSYKQLFTFYALLVLGVSFSSHVYAENSARLHILSYVGLNQEQDIGVIEDHLSYFKSNRVPVMTLKNIGGFLKGRKDGVAGVAIVFFNILPERLKNIEPLFQERKLPFTAFISFDEWRAAEDKELLQTLTKKNGVAFGLILPEYKENQNVNDFRSELNRSVAFYREIFNSPPKYVAFSGGLYSKDMKDVLGDYDFEVIMGTNTGVLTSQNILDDWPVSEIDVSDDATLQSLEMTLQTHSFHVEDVLPTATIVHTQKPNLGFTVKGEDTEELEERLKCYASDIGKINMYSILGKRVELRPELEPFKQTKINCIYSGEEDKQGTTQWSRIGFFLQYIPKSNLQDELPEPQE